jgi:ferredoxin
MDVEIRYFSATGSTRKVATEFARGLDCKVRYVNITLPENRADMATVEVDLEVIAVPVHGERIPGFIFDHLRRINGNGRPLVVFAVYGNMDIGISLGQFERLAQECNFRLIAAGAFVGEHSFCRFGSLRQAQGAAVSEAQSAAVSQAKGAAVSQSQGATLSQAQSADASQAQEVDYQNPVYTGNHVGMGRPDQGDLTEVYRFGQCVREKLENGNNDCIALPKPRLPMFIAGFPERGTRFIVRRPDADLQICRQCGACAMKCPVGAIDRNNYDVDESKCIRCMACVRNCPVSARSSGFKLKTFDRVFGYIGRKPKPNIMIY